MLMDFVVVLGFILWETNKQLELHSSRSLNLLRHNSTLRRSLSELVMDWICHEEFCPRKGDIHQKFV